MSNEVELPVRQAAVIYLKNMVSFKRHSQDSSLYLKAFQNHDEHIFTVHFEISILTLSFLEGSVHPFVIMLGTNAMCPLIFGTTSFQLLMVYTSKSFASLVKRGPSSKPCKE